MGAGAWMRLPLARRPRQSKEYLEDPLIHHRLDRFASTEFEPGK
jgi:hypothetical protein